MKFTVLLTSVDSPMVAKKLAHNLVTARLAACVTLVPNVQSTYRWRGKIEVAKEQLLIIKTTISKVSTIKREFRRLHPYEVPELIAVSLRWVSTRYGRWLEESMRDR